MNQHRIRSIPRRTILDVLREQEGGRGLIGQSSLEQSPEGFSVQDHVIRKPTGERPSGSLVAPENERITWQVDTIEDYNSAGDLGLVMQFSGISFMSPPIFVRSRDNYSPDSSVFYSPVGYYGPAVLILSTFEDIVESQVVPKTRDVHPFFREEIHCPPLLTRYDPASMRPSYDNGLVIVTYKARGLN